ncbi:crotonase/enoyl-CoA hydratase family protein [Oceanicella actignis]|uniref:crotonase/enoyl-CoA hydratase family protein n=1 Tax=Oceanicella actignis TaxID=1189325 RepID=UPI0011E699E1|nr:crotonase/enoyl-CoA hydratase family protein [Oceanicella actignis]TYO85021.1 enoyl-CoA hydratase [Oceanicella actignis]
MTADSTLRIRDEGPVRVIAIDRPERRNAVDPETAQALFEAFLAFDADPAARVAVLTGCGEAFCAGFDLTRAAQGMPEAWFERMAIRAPEDLEGPPRPGPMGPTRLSLSKPTIAAVNGAAVAGGLELALWCDLRVVAPEGYFGVFCRRWGVPLIDGGAIRLPRLIGQGRALDLILSGRKVAAEEALAIGLAERAAPPGGALSAALELAQELARFPQACMRADRRVALAQWSLSAPEAFALEWRSADAFAAEGVHGAARFAAGKGRGGAFDDL